MAYCKLRIAFSLSVFGVSLVFNCNLNVAADQLKSGTESIELRTDGLPTPIVLFDGLNKVQYTSVRLEGKLQSEENDRGTLTFIKDKLEFNEFGDVQESQEVTIDSRDVTFKRTLQIQDACRSGIVDIDEKRRLYELVFADSKFAKQLYLVLSSDTTGPHRLVIRSRNKRKNGDIRMMSPDNILDLYGLPEIKSPHAEEPLNSTIHLTTLSAAHSKTYDQLDGRLARFTIEGNPQSNLMVKLDGNYLSINSFGDVVLRTMMDFGKIATTLKEVNVVDPKNMGRRLFEIVLDTATVQAEYSLVLAPTEAGFHRLLIKKDGDLRHVLPLYSADRSSHWRMEKDLAKVSTAERQAVETLRETIGYRFHVHFESNAIVGLRVESGGNANLLGSALRSLPNLRTLWLCGSQLDTEGLPSRRYLKNLHGLGFTDSVIEDEGLAGLNELPNLRGLDFYDCQGFSQDGLKHIGRLKNLEGLTICRVRPYEMPSRHEVIVTDTGLKELKGLTKLKNLTVQDQQITDVGLRHLIGLSNLTKLQLSGDGITDAGLKNFNELDRLEYLNLERTRVTAEGAEDLRQQLTNLGQIYPFPSGL